MKKIFLVLLFLLAFLERILIDLGPNFEFITTVLILSSLYFSRKQTFYLIFFILLATDLILGNTNIAIFTWSGFLLPAILVPTILKKIKNNKFLVSLGSGILANLFFYNWTNFGVWALDSWGMYTKDLSGLILCYINALPFLKYQLISTIILLPSSLVIIKIVRFLLKVKLHQPAFKRNF